MSWRSPETTRRRAWRRRPQHRSRFGSNGAWKTLRLISCDSFLCDSFVARLSLGRGNRAKPRAARAGCNKRTINRLLNESDWTAFEAWEIGQTVQLVISYL